VTRAQQLVLWRTGYEAGRHDQAATDMGILAAAIRHTAATRQRQLLTEVIGVLARAMLGDACDQERAAQ
jgi:hypothetical protein